MSESTGVQVVPIDKIFLTGWNPRGEEAYQGEKFGELKTSIITTGLWKSKALLVRPWEDGYQLIAGHRRLRAAQEVGLKEVPVIIEDLDDREAKVKLFLDNFHREDFEPLEEAKMIQELLGDGMKQDELGRKMGKSQSYIANRLRLLKAPDELKGMIISRKITPKHVISLLPLTEYPVLKEKIIPEIKRLQQYSEVSVRQVENLVDSAITGDYQAEAVLHLNDFPYELSDYEELFDRTGCQGCKHIFVQKEEYDPEDLDEGDEPPEDNLFCLNRRCWSDRLNIAKQKYEKARAKVTEKLSDKDTVDTSKLKWGEYDEVSSFDKWDKTECQTCKNKKLPKKKSGYAEFICIDPACSKKKEAAYEKEKREKEKKEAERAFEKLDAYIAEKPTISDAEVRGLIKILVRHLWGDSIKKALKPWTPKGGKWNVDEVDKIPDEDVLKALLRLVFVQDLTAHNYQGVNVKAVEKVITVFEGKPVPKEEE